jgi:protein tyrosine phosphatase (PTP) superfamily phosphohydrolase (DUF442 family)
MRTCSAAILLGLTLAIPVAAQPTTSPAVKAVKAPSIQIDNFGRVSPSYYRGAQPKGHDYADLAALGVKTIIDLTAGDDASEPTTVQGLGMKFVRIPMTTRVVPTAAQLAQFLKLVNDSDSQPVYVHCAGGRHRTGVMTAAYRMIGGWTADQAFAEMKKYKFGSDFLHPEFKKFVFGYRTDLDHAIAAQPVTRH